MAISTLSVGAHNAFTAQYGGDANFNGSTSGSYLHIVSTANTTTSQASAPNLSMFGQSMTFMATLSGGVATYVSPTSAAGRTPSAPLTAAIVTLTAVQPARSIK